MGTGSQSEWEQLDNLTRRIEQEAGHVEYSLDSAVVDPLEVSAHIYALTLEGPKRKKK